jgi:hypothetical protein
VQEDGAKNSVESLRASLRLSLCLVCQFSEIGNDTGMQDSDNIHTVRAVSVSLRKISSSSGISIRISCSCRIGSSGAQLQRRHTHTVSTSAHWSNLFVVGDGCGMVLVPVAPPSPVHPWSPPGHRLVRLTLEVRHEFCGVRWPRTRGPATGLCAIERRSVSDRLSCPGTTGCPPAAPTARRTP